MGENRMTTPTLGYYTDADTLRQALRNGPLSRPDIVKATDLTREQVAKSLYALKKKGDVIEEGDLVMLATTAETEPAPTQDMPIPATETALESTQDTEVVHTYQNGAENVTEGKITASPENPATDPIAAITAVIHELAMLRRENAEILDMNDRLAAACDALRRGNAELKQRLERIRTALETDV